MEIYWQQSNDHIATIRFVKHASLESMVQEHHLPDMSSQPVFYVVAVDNNFYTWDSATKRVIVVIPENIHRKILERIARSGNVPILDRLAQVNDASLRKIIAQNAEASEDTLDRLARDVEAQVRVAVAGNWTTRLEALESLMEDVDANVSSLAHSSYRSRFGSGATGYG